MTRPSLTASSRPAAARTSDVICAAAQIATYKANLKRSLSSPPSFDTQWDYGWQRATPTLLQYQSLKVGDPQDYESRVHLVCATLHRIGKRVTKAPDNSSQTKP
jgi:hypothetical protein